MFNSHRITYINKLQALRDCFYIKLYYSKKEYSKKDEIEKNEIKIAQLTTEIEISKITNKIDSLVEEYRSEIVENYGLL